MHVFGIPHLNGSFLKFCFAHWFVQKRGIPSAECFFLTATLLSGLFGVSSKLMAAGRSFLTKYSWSSRYFIWQDGLIILITRISQFLTLIINSLQRYFGLQHKQSREKAVGLSREIRVRDDKRPFGIYEIKLAARYSNPSISTTFQAVDCQFLD